MKYRDDLVDLVAALSTSKPGGSGMKQFLIELFEYHPNWVIGGCIITALVCFYVMID